jgi:aerobic-type carbon monoxide dehydrogenase small subunit (CoxS/CutS family)
MEDMLEDTVLVNLRINGKLYELEIPPHKSLLDLLRDDLNLTGTHMGCMTGHCGACTVSIDGRVAKSCITLAATLGRAKITTIEGLAKDDGTLSAVQQAFWDEAGFQCAFCAPGMLLCTSELLDGNPDPTDEDIEKALAGNLCRCTGYQSIRRAVKAAIASRQQQADQVAE